MGSVNPEIVGQRRKVLWMLLNQRKWKTQCQHSGDSTKEREKGQEEEESTGENGKEVKEGGVSIGGIAFCGFEF